MDKLKGVIPNFIILIMLIIVIIGITSVAYAYEPVGHVVVTSQRAQASDFGFMYQWTFLNEALKDTKVKVEVYKNGGWININTFELEAGKSVINKFFVGNGDRIKVYTMQEDLSYILKDYRVNDVNISINDVQVTSLRATASIFGEKFYWQFKNTDTVDTRVIVMVYKDGSWIEGRNFELKAGQQVTDSFPVEYGEKIIVKTRKGDATYQTKEHRVLADNMLINTVQVESIKASADEFGEKFCWKFKNIDAVNTNIIVKVRKSDGWQEELKFDLKSGQQVVESIPVECGKKIRVETRKGDGSYSAKEYIVMDDVITVKDIEVTSIRASADQFGEKFKWQFKNADVVDTYVKVFVLKEKNWEEARKFKVEAGKQASDIFSVDFGTKIRVATRKGDGSYQFSEHIASDANMIIDDVEVASLRASGNIFGNTYKWQFKNSDSVDTYVIINAIIDGKWSVVRKFELEAGKSKTDYFDVENGKTIRVATRKGDGSFNTKEYSVLDANIFFNPKEIIMSADKVDSGKIKWRFFNKSHDKTLIKITIDGEDKVLETLELLPGKSEMVLVPIKRGTAFKYEVCQGDLSFYAYEYGLKAYVDEILSRLDVKISDYENAYSDYNWKKTAFLIEDYRSDNGFRALAVDDLNKIEPLVAVLSDSQLDAYKEYLSRVEGEDKYITDMLKTIGESLIDFLGADMVVE